MKALSVRQPWASLIVSGRKTIEVRSWRTAYRGDILICASRHVDTAACQYFNLDPAKQIVGQALCIARLVGCRHERYGDVIAACCSVASDEYCWLLADIRPVQPFEVKGQLGLFEVPNVHQGPL